MSGPTLSVVVPTCNRREEIVRCIAALGPQASELHEVIVVDDGSNDGTAGALEAVGREHPGLPLRVLVNPRNLGANASRNRGVAAATGDLVGFLDSDSVPQPGWAAAMRSAFGDARTAAVVGLVRDQDPENVYELAFRGTHRVAASRDGTARRLVGCNMCVRRSVLVEHGLDEDRSTTARTSGGAVDTTVSGRGDEEGLALLIRASGLRLGSAPDAAVLHVHHYTRRSFFRQAFRGGRSAARLVYKFGLGPRVDLLPFMLGWATLPLVLVRWWLVVVPAAWWALGLAAITYNDLFRKGKTVGETVRSFPVLVAYYQVRMCGYALEWVRLRLGASGISRVDLRATRPADASDG